MDDWLPRAVARRPDHPAVVEGGVTLSYAELLERAREAHPGLHSALGVHALLLRGGPVVVHTSGTTGEPRPIELSAENILASAQGTAELLGILDDDRWLVPIPLHHVGGLMVLLRSVIYGTTAVIGQRDPDATLASMVPTQIARGLHEGMPRLRAILVGGGPMRIDGPGHLIRQTYGMTETTSMATLDGVPLPGVDVSISDDGEILVAGPIVAGGGVHHTGDLGRIVDGRLQVIGRKKELIITGGENVAPAEVEAVIAEHPAVRDVAVVGRPDPEWGEMLVALVVGDVDAADLHAFCRARLPGFKVPKRFESVPGLPRTDSGKLKRAALR